MISLLVALLPRFPSALNMYSCQVDFDQALVSQLFSISVQSVPSLDILWQVLGGSSFQRCSFPQYTIQDAQDSRHFILWQHPCRGLFHHVSAQVDYSQFVNH